MTGTIVFYDFRKGWGFIDAPDLKRDLFFHCSQLPEADRRRHDLQNAAVTFEQGERDSKPIAVNVRLLTVRDVLSGVGQ